MKQISNADFASVLRLLDALSKMRGDSVREREAARKAALLAKKLKKKDGRTNKNRTILPGAVCEGQDDALLLGERASHGRPGRVVRHLDKEAGNGTRDVRTAGEDMLVETIK